MGIEMRQLISNIDLIEYYTLFAVLLVICFIATIRQKGKKSGNKEDE